MPPTSLLHLPLLSQFKTLTLTSPSLHGPTPPSRTFSPPRPFSLRIRCMKKMQGRVVCSTNDKTVNVEVVRLAAHPKYRRLVRIKKKYQAHDPANKFKVGDLVLLERSRPISKTKAFIALPVPPRNSKKKEKGVLPPPEQIEIPFESQLS